MKTDQLKDLLQLAETAFAAEQSKLAHLSSQEHDLRDQLAALMSSRQQSVDRLAPTPAGRAGAEVRWHRWIDSRRETLNRELASVLAKRATAVSSVRKAFGKKEALAALVARAKADDLQQQNRRRDYTS